MSCTKPVWKASFSSEGGEAFCVVFMSAAQRENMRTLRWGMVTVRIDPERVAHLLRTTKWSIAKIARVIGCQPDTIYRINRRFKVRTLQRRWRRIPAELLQVFEEMIRETDLPAEACMEAVGLKKQTATLSAIVRKHRRYVGLGRWVDQQTGKLRPEICTAACVADKTGMSKKTIMRRVKSGLVEPERAISHIQVSVFSDDDVARIREVGLFPPGPYSNLTREDVAWIREQAAAGVTQTRIAEQLPPDKRVSRRQIGRIVDGTRWGRVTKRGDETHIGKDAKGSAGPKHTPEERER